MINNRQRVILWVAGLAVSAYFLIAPVIIVPILIVGGLFFWAFKDIDTPLTGRFVVCVAIVVAGLWLLGLCICAEHDFDFWFTSPHSLGARAARRYGR